MKKFQSENSVAVPTFFTRNMGETDKASFEETYKAVAWMLRIMRNRLETQRDSLARDSENLVEANELLKNSAERKAYRTLIEYLPE